MLGEGEQHRLQSTFFRFLNHLMNETAMPTMHTIKKTYGSNLVFLILNDLSMLVVNNQSPFQS